MDKILFDLTPLETKKKVRFHGGGEYAKSVFLRLVSVKSENTILGFYNFDNTIDTQVSNIIKNKKIKIYDVKKKEDLNELLEKYKFKRFYSALPLYHYDLNPNVNFVYTIHGLRSLEVPKDKYEKLFIKNGKALIKYFYKRLSIKRYKQKIIDSYKLMLNKEPEFVVVPSLHTKYSLLNLYPNFNHNKLKVLYSPPKSKFLDKSLLDNFIYSKTERKNFLIVSGGIWYKNSIRAIIALDSIFDNFHTQNAIILGVDNKLEYKIRKNFIKNNKRFIFKNYVTEEELNNYYKKSFSIIYPSLSEGFGYPPLEAMYFGTPVIASCSSSISEVCGNAVLYFDSRNIVELKVRILTLIFEKTKWDDLSKKSIERFTMIYKKQLADLDELTNLILS